MSGTLVPARKKGNLEIEFEIKPLFMYLHLLYTFVKQKNMFSIALLYFLNY
jgi:hypothetical protein